MKWGDFGGAGGCAFSRLLPKNVIVIMSAIAIVKATCCDAIGMQPGGSSIVVTASWPPILFQWFFAFCFFLTAMSGFSFLACIDLVCKTLG